MTEQGAGINILITDSLSYSASPLENTAILQSLPDLANIPAGWELSGGNRKFVVLGRELQSTEDVALVIGPDMHKPEVGAYYHKSLRGWAQRHVVDGAGNIFGGGAIRFSGQGEDGRKEKWTANFSGSSVDFGVFSPALLFFGVNVSRVLGMSVNFVWKGGNYLLR